MMGSCRFTVAFSVTLWKCVMGAMLVVTIVVVGQKEIRYYCWQLEQTNSD